MAMKIINHNMNSLIFLMLIVLVTIMINQRANFIKVVTGHEHHHHIKRTQYHEQGLHGPKSYKFGYTSGDHKNPQERHEESDGHGHVKGWYSFVDANGKYQKIHYEAHPKYGFKVYNPHMKAYNNGKRHYGS